MYKAILHDHLDGGLRATTAKELAYSMNYKALIELLSVLNSRAPFTITKIFCLFSHLEFKLLSNKII